MSLKQLGLIAMIGFILGGLLFRNSGLPPSRSPSSELPPLIKTWGHSLSSKPNQAIQVRIFAVNGIPSKDDQELRLRGEVILHRPMEQEVQFQWTLPPNAQVVSGETEDVWPLLQVGQVASTEISLLGVSKESLSKTVTLHVAGWSNGVQYAGAASFAADSLQEAAQTSLATGFQGSPSTAPQKNGDDMLEKLKKVHQ